MILAAGAAGFAGTAAGSAVPKLFRTADPARILAAGRALISADAVATLITVDGEGQPRARSIRVSAPEPDLTIWMGTRRGSRKLAQIAARPAATLHFADDAGGAYVSLMGRARIVTDPATMEAKNPYRGAERAQFFPDYPRDFALIGFTPAWLEVSSAELPGAPDTWQPEGLSL